MYEEHDRSARRRGPARPPGDGLTQRDLLPFTEVVGPAAPPPAAGGWFRVRVTIGHDGVVENSWTNAWVPSARLLRARDDTGEGYTWYTVPRDTALLIAR